MVKINFNELVKKGHSRYAFVVAIAKRAREITDEQLELGRDQAELERTRSTLLDRPKASTKPMEEEPEKPIRLAVEEYLEGKFDFVEKE